MKNDSVQLGIRILVVTVVERSEIPLICGIDRNKNSFSLASIKGSWIFSTQTICIIVSRNFPSNLPYAFILLLRSSLSYKCHLMIPCNFSGIMISLMDHPHPKSNSTGCHRSLSLVVSKNWEKLPPGLKSLLLYSTFSFLGRVGTWWHVMCCFVY